MRSALPIEFSRYSMEAGKLRHRVTFQRPSDTQDTESGAIIPGWENVFDLWASIEPLSGRDFIAAQEHQSAISARITVRYQSVIDTNMRVLHRGKYYTIEAIMPDQKSGMEYLTLLVSEGAHKE